MLYNYAVALKVILKTTEGKGEIDKCLPDLASAGMFVFRRHRFIASEDITNSYCITPYRNLCFKCKYLVMCHPHDTDHTDIMFHVISLSLTHKMNPPSLSNTHLCDYIRARTHTLLNIIFQIRDI